MTESGELAQKVPAMRSLSDVNGIEFGEHQYDLDHQQRSDADFLATAADKPVTLGDPVGRAIVGILFVCRPTTRLPS
jgi:hypothetical protein